LNIFSVSSIKITKDKAKKIIAKFFAASKSILNFNLKATRFKGNCIIDF